MDIELVKILIPNKGKKENLQAEVEGWIGKAYRFSRLEISSNKSQDPLLQNTGVYILLGEEQGEDAIYIGKSEHVYQRIQAHLKSNDNIFRNWPNFYWNRALLFVSKDNGLHDAHVQYIENELFQLATNSGRYKIMNRNTPTRCSMSDFDCCTVSLFLDKIQMVIETLGYTFLKPVLTEEESKNSTDMWYTKNKKGATAKAFMLEEEFVVLKGSKITGEFTDSTPSCFLRKLEDLQNRGIIVDHTFVKNYPFSSPSTAGVIVLGRNVNGRKVWKSKEGISIENKENQN